MFRNEKQAEEGKSMKKHILIRSASLAMVLTLLCGLLPVGAFAAETDYTMYSTAEFEAQYTYDGDDLGALWTKDFTTFRVWAPTADSVKVNLYEAGKAGVEDRIDQNDMHSRSPSISPGLPGKREREN